MKLRVYNAVYGPGPARRSLLREGSSSESAPITVSPSARSRLSSTAHSVRAARPCSSPTPTRRTPPGFFTAERRGIAADASKRPCARGIQIETHAIGDRANRAILDLYETGAENGAAREAKDPRAAVAGGACPDSRPRRTSHVSRNSASSPRCNHPTPSAICSSRRVGSAKNGSPAPTPGRACSRSGAIIAGGSDAPVERGEPMIEFYAAVARKSVKGESAKAGIPSRPSRGSRL